MSATTSTGAAAAPAASENATGATGAEIAAVRAAGARAAAAARALRRAAPQAVSTAIRLAARLLSENAAHILAANAVDAEQATRTALSEGMVDRLRLDPGRITAMVDQLEVLAAMPVPARDRFIRTLADGGRVLERRVPIGVVGAIFEARPNVPVDLASQVLLARSAVVMRTGAAALSTSACLVENVLVPALSQAGLPADAVQLLRLPGHGAADALLTQPDLIPLVVVRGSGPVTSRLSALGAAAGVQVLSHADGGGVLFIDAAADLELARTLIAQSLDRLGVCNRLNLLLLHEQLPAAAVTAIDNQLAALGVTVSRAPHAHPLGYEWALDAGHEATVTVHRVPNAVAAAELAEEETSGLAATICTTDHAAAAEFLDSYGGTSALWNTSTRLVDGFKMLGLPETGINVERTLGPRGPVTFPDLGMRQFVVLPPA